MPNDIRKYHIVILGRTLEHLGSQMYKRRDAAIAELVANSWDAGATEVQIDVPADKYDPSTASINIRDDGRGMDPDSVETDYLIVGRNTRQDGHNKVGNRLIMGRKGIGKLAGFGIASKMTLLTWQKDRSVELSLDINELKTEDGKTESKPLIGILGEHPEGIKSESGTLIKLSGLKQVTAVDIEQLHQSLARRFSRSLRGEMKIYINGEPLREAQIDFVERFPEKGFEEVVLPDGKKISYWYGISEKVIKPSLMQGFAIMVREKIAQSPPFYFGVENTASHQVGTKYFTGEIFANCLDAGIDDESDKISTDRQEIAWDDPETVKINEWGQKVVRGILTRVYERKASEIVRWVIEDDPGFKERIAALDNASRDSIKKVLRTLGDSGIESREEALSVADGLIRAYEFQQFFDLTEEIESTADEDPVKLHELLKQISSWRILESRAMLELMKGRLKISDTLHTFIVNDLPETASAKSTDNLHDLVARMPWILHPDWELFDEEKTISKQLEEWNAKNVALTIEQARLRYDFIAFSGKGELIIIEIKRAGHAVEIEEMNRLLEYKELLAKGRKDKIIAVIITGGTFNVTLDTLENFKKRNDFRFETWADVCDRTRKYYEHYRGILEGNVMHKDFNKKEMEVSQYKEILAKGTVKRDKKARKDSFAVKKKGKKSIKKTVRKNRPTNRRK
jgi:Histidine kinase-, DNA gyrase B-, and HSP90-like ATPase